MLRTLVRLSPALALAAALALAGLSQPRAARAEALTSNTNVKTQDVVFFQFVPCANNGAGEFVSLSGTMHEILHYAINDNHVTVDTFSNFQNFSGTGLTTGDKYRLAGSSSAVQAFELGGAPEADTFVSTFNLIGQGSAPDLLFHDVTHITVNNNGEVTTLHNNFHIECR